jgi:hypothetical protein
MAVPTIQLDQDLVVITLKPGGVPDRDRGIRLVDSDVDITLFYV